MNIICLTLGVCSTNCYIAFCDGDDVCTVIDPADNAQTIVAAARARGLTIGGILLTHAHFDHIAALNELCDMTGAPVYVGTDEKHSLYDSVYNLSQMFIGRSYIFGKDAISVSDGDTVTVGKAVFKVMETPGHTEGSVCYLCENELFTGDTLFSGTIGRTDLPGGDYGKIIKSLRRLLLLDGGLSFHPGHGDGGKIAYEKDHNPYA